MKPNFLLVAALIFLVIISAEAKDWRGITPLHSTRADVTRLLGESPDANEIRANYELENERVYIVFSSQNSKYHSCEEKLPPETVLLIQITYKNSIDLPELKNNPAKFRQIDPTGYPVEGLKGYIDEQEGVIYKTSDGLVREAHYIASAKDAPRCASYYEKPESFISMIIDFHTKIDEFGKISYLDETARLDPLAIQLQESPELEGHIIAYGKRAEATKRLARMRNYLIKKRKIAPQRIKTKYGGEGDFTVQLHVIPSKSRFPLIG